MLVVEKRNQGMPLFMGVRPMARGFDFVELITMALWA
jgi:hypothetical protein